MIAVHTDTALRVLAHFVLFAALAVVAALLAPAHAFAESASAGDTAGTMAAKPSIAADPAAGGPAIGGFSPVAYFTQGAAVRGKAEHAVEHVGEVYWLASAEEAAAFAADPERYAPLFGAFCPYNLTLGRETPIDPTNFRIVGGQLLLFHRSDDGTSDGLERWRASPFGEEELLRRATGQFRLIRF